MGIKISDYATREEVRHDLEVWKEKGIWEEGIPEWVVAIGEWLDVATGSISIYTVGLEYLVGFRF